MRKSKAETNFFVKILMIVVASITFIMVIMYGTSFRKSTIEEKEAANFKMDVMSTLQELTTNKDNLAYEYNGTSRKVILDKNKIDSFASRYENIEPEAAKALGFDYNIIIIQPEYGFSLYPGDKMIQGELTMSNDFYSHIYSKEVIIYTDCNFDPKENEQLCRENTELDQCYCIGCTENPRENCPYPHAGGGRGGICCVFFACPKDACESVEIKPGMGDCGSACVVAKGCDLSKCKLENENRNGCGSGFPHGACGMTYDYTWVPTGETINIDLKEKIWSFGLSLGVDSFSPVKAKKEELQLSLPVTIRYNDTFSAEGTIYIYAVRGELESLYGVIEDICEKAKLDDSSEIKLSKEFSLSYPVRYYDSSICMLNSCKVFDCPYDLNFENIEQTGNYLLKFDFNPDSKTITVEK